MHSSKAMMISLPRFDCIFIDISGLRKRSEPSMCEKNFTPRSLTWASFLEEESDFLFSGKMLPNLFMLCSLPRPSEKAWNPPESVKRGLWKFMKWWRPLRRLIVSSPGARWRW